jgi:hypothetical protein
MVTDKGKNLIFILSLPRSGSTLLSAILGNHNKISCPVEPWFLLRLREIIGSPSLPNVYDDYWASVGTRNFISQESFVECARAFALSAYNQHLREKQRDIMIDKTPRYYHILDFIEKLFPEAIKIWLKRDPLDVMASYKSSWNIGSDILSAQKIDSSSFDFIVGLHSLERYFSEKTPFKYLVKYEDVVSKPVEEIAKLCTFCGIPFEKGMLDYADNSSLIASFRNTELGDRKVIDCKTVHVQSVGKWQKVLTTEEIEALVSVIGTNIFRTMGYDETARYIREKMGVIINPSDRDLVDIRKQLIANYSSGIHFCWELSELRRRLGSNKEFVETLLDNNGVNELNAFAAERNVLITERDALVAERDVLVSERQALLAIRDLIAAESDSCRAERDAMHNSLSWRVTAPLRYIGKYFMERHKS